MGFEIASEVEQLIDAVNLLGSAIKSLKQEPSGHEYIYPITLSFFSALFGVLLGYLIVWLQEENKRIKKAIDDANFWIFAASDCFSNLSSIKHKYIDSLTDEPLQRCLIKVIPFHFPDLDVNVTNLAFIAPKTHPPNTPVGELGFDSITPINAMFRNYNILLAQWRHRNELVRPLLKKIIDEHHTGGNRARVSQVEILKSIGPIKLADLISETEQAISRTDENLQKLSDFLAEFPRIAKTAIVNSSKYYSIREALGFRISIIKINQDPTKLERILKRVPVDPEKLKVRTSYVQPIVETM